MPEGFFPHKASAAVGQRFAALVPTAPGCLPAVNRALNLNCQVNFQGFFPRHRLSKLYYFSISSSFIVVERVNVFFLQRGVLNFHIGLNSCFYLIILNCWRSLNRDELIVLFAGEII